MAQKSGAVSVGKGRMSTYLHFHQNEDRPELPGDPAPCVCLAWKASDPSGIRTRVAAVKGRCPGPLDDGAKRAREPDAPRKGEQYADGSGIVNWRGGSDCVVE